MSVREIIQQIQRLTPAERQELAEVLAEMEAVYAPAKEGAREPHLRPRFEEMATEVFAEHRELLARLAQ